MGLGSGVRHRRPGDVTRLTIAFDTEVAYVNDILPGKALLNYAQSHRDPVGGGRKIAGDATCAIHCASQDAISEFCMYRRRGTRHYDIRPGGSFLLDGR